MRSGGRADQVVAVIWTVIGRGGVQAQAQA